MTYDLFVRFDDTHTTYAELAVVDATLTEHGLHKTSGNQWILDVMAAGSSSISRR